MSKLHNARGRITYISSHAKQENLYAVYETTDRSYWTELARYNQQEFLKSGTEGKCIEARELIIALPESFPDLYQPDKLLQLFTDRFKEKYGVECVSALHHNKRKTNYHIHLIFSERQLLQEPVEKIATRNMFYDEQGRHVRTKKEILDDNGNIRKGCKIIKKGDIYERQIFSTKDTKFKAEYFLDTLKQDYTNLINQFVKDEKQKLQVFERGGIYLATKKIGKNNPKAETIKTDNQVRTEWNQTVDRAIVTGIPKSDIMQIKKEQITDKVSESIKDYGNRPNMLSAIIGAAISLLELMITLALRKVSEISDRTTKKEQGNSIKKDSFSEKQENGMEQPKSATPPKPQPTKEALAYKQLSAIYEKLQTQNKSIFTEEQKRNALENELFICKGIFKGKRRAELTKEIDNADKRISNMKLRLSSIVKEYGYENVEVFYKAFHRAMSANVDYKTALKKWEKQYGEKKQSLRDRLQAKKQELLEQQTEKIYRPSKDRGAR